MPSEQIQHLKRALLDVYGSFADKRIKNIDRGDRFIVDGRTRGDIASDGSVYSWFCSMFLEVHAAETVSLNIINLPMNAAVAAWVKEHATSFGRDGQRVEIARGTEGMLSDLAVRVAAITARGQRYDTASYKHSVPRVVDALERLQGALSKGWGER